MNIFKALFGGSQENPEEKEKKENEKNFDLLKFDGVKALRLRQPEYAVKCFRCALQIKEDDETRDYLTQALIANNELIDAINELKILADKITDNAAIYIRLAKVAYMSDDYELMYASCTKALEIEKDDYHTMYYKAVAAEGLSRRDEAIEILDKIVSSAEDSASALLLRGELYLKDNKLDEASNDAEMLNETNPDDEDILLLLAKIRHAQNKLEDAEILCSKVIELDPFCLEAFRERALVRKDLGDKEGEESDIRTVIELNPEEISADDNPAQTMTQKIKDSQINPLGI